MANLKEWYDGIVREVDQQKSRLSEKGQKKYGVDSLLRASKRIADFSDECEECRGFQGEISNLVSRLGSAEQFSRDERKEHARKLKTLITHLQKRHKLVPGGYYIGAGAVLGVSIGVAIGTALQNIAVGVGVGIALGAGIGSAMDAKAKKEGKVI